jgi:hypothetical protein
VGVFLRFLPLDADGGPRQVPRGSPNGTAQHNRPRRAGFDRGRRRRSIMLHYAVIFFVVAIIAAIFGFSV